MKLMPEQIARLEQFLTDYESGATQLELLGEYSLYDTDTLSRMVRGLRNLGIDVKKGKRNALSRSDRAKFSEWLRGKRAREYLNG